ncbi:ImmA/IrrE family metallo-endopeptidase, partial [Klebsiella pneumoniae]
LIESLSRTEALLLTHHQIEEIASKLREHWGVGISPIQDLTKRIEKSGVIVTRFEIGYDDMDGSSAWINDRPFIFIAADKDNYFRSRFDISHELGHLIMHKNLTQEDKKVRFDLLEEQAHYFASCLLFPPNAFIAEANKISIESLTM